MKRSNLKDMAKIDKISSRYVGKEYNGIQVVSFSHRRGYIPYFNFQCHCGNCWTTQLYLVTAGRIKSCGCVLKKYLKGQKTTHGGTYKKEYTIWENMLGRCYNKNSQRFDRYGGRGIVVCERWRHSFSNFLEDMGDRPTDKHSIERVNNNGNYEPSNCKWATKEEQAKNTSFCIYYRVGEITQHVNAWSRQWNKQYRTTMKILKEIGTRVEYSETIT